jgi:hypothetical protein
MISQSLTYIFDAHYSEPFLAYNVGILQKIFEDRDS